jgi:putative membrane protein
MIVAYSDHAANERTFLAWIRTGIAVIAFGVVIAKFNLFMLALASTAVGQGQRSELASLFRRVGRYDGLALIFGGVCLVVLATIRFIRTARLLDDAQMHSATSLRTELILSGWLVLMVVSYGVFLAFG